LHLWPREDNNDLENLDVILGWADLAMYQAKDAKRNQICFYQQKLAKKTGNLNNNKIRYRNKIPPYFYI